MDFIRHMFREKDPNHILSLLLGAIGNSVQRKIPECPVMRMIIKSVNLLLNPLSRFVFISSEDCPWTEDRPRSTSAARDTLCVESADPIFRLVQPAGEL